MTYFHEEQRFGWWPWAIVAVVGVSVVAMSIGIAARAPSDVLPLVFGPIVVALIVALFAFAKLVTDVDERGIHVSFHMLWPARHIPLADVKRAHALEYSSLRYGGWGVHYMLPRVWSFDAGGGHGVLVETNSGPQVLISSRRASELEAAIAKAVAERAAR